jgi:hypothetical protein
MDWDSATVTGLLAVAAALLIHVNERIKDRRLRHVESMVKFAEDFYTDEHMSELFLKIQSGTLEPIETGTKDEVALAHLLEYHNTVGIALERRLVPLKAIAATSIAYVVLTMSRNEVVTSYIEFIRDKHSRKPRFPSPGWPQFEYLAQRLEVHASEHKRTPDLRPGYGQFIDPKRRWHAAKYEHSQKRAAGETERSERKGAPPSGWPQRHRRDAQPPA